MEPETIEIKHAREHNLRAVSLSLPRNALIVFTGVSGSGKSSLAFDTLYAEGQRRYIESLSSYARQFMGQMQKPDCDQITGLSPAIAIQQKTTGWNPRSTVGTITGIYDFLRVLYARVGTQHCTSCGQSISAQSREQIVEGILEAFGGGTRVLVLAPVARGQKGEFRDLFDDLIRAGYVRARVDGTVVELREDLALQKNQRHDIEVVVDRLAVEESARSRLAEAVEGALRVGKGTLIIASADGREEVREGILAPAGVGARKDSRTSSSRVSGHRRDAGATRDTGVTRGGCAIGEKVFSSKYACPHCSISFDPPTPQLFSFNSPSGMCLRCDGLGELSDFDPTLLVPDPSLSFWGPCVAPMRTKIGRWRRHIYRGVAKAVGFDIGKPWKDLPKKARDALLYGTGDRHIAFEWRWSGGVWKHGGTFEGVIEELRSKYRKAKASFVREYYEKYMRRGPCPDCGGARLNAQAMAVRLVEKRRKPKIESRKSKAENRKSKVESRKSKRRDAALSGPWQGGGDGRPGVHELCGMSVAEAYETVGRLSLSPVETVIAEEVLKEIRARLEFLLNVGLHYLTLDRTAPTLSGGELQRIRLAGQIGSGLAGVLYILDEPSIGLHARDNERLLESLQQLRDMGNTVIVVEHDEATMRAADHIVDFGPGPGVRGGEVVAAGVMADIVGTEASLTGRYLAGDEEIAVPSRRPVVVRRGRRRRGGKSKVESRKTKNGK